ncbi:MAG: hypothetical protein NZL89_03005, partial [Leptospiraceae bacterium]|nr:hypothetical protein [Leptospiraceae bacterium]
QRTEDLPHIAAEYIRQRNYAPLTAEKSVLATRLLEQFDISSGYKGLFLTLDLLHEMHKSKGMPVFALLRNLDKSEAYEAARRFLREMAAPVSDSLFHNLAETEKVLTLDAVEQHYIKAVCERYGWQMTDAARHLGISRKTLYEKIRRYGIKRPIANKRRRIS